MKPTPIPELRRPDQSVAGLLAEVAALQQLNVAGLVEVELIDDRTGRTVEKIAAPNYVNATQWSNFAKALQKLAWTWAYPGAASTITSRAVDQRDPRTAPTFRGDHVACWADTTAGDNTDRYAFGEVIAWAHRWEQGSPSTRQGIVQPTLCTLAENSIAWTWEWVTSNGNGTFQSVGWRRLGMSANTGDAALYDHPVPGRRCIDFTTAGADTISLGSSTQESWTAGGIDEYGGVMYYDSGSSKLYGITLIAGNLWKLFSWAVTLDATSGNYTLGAFTDESAAAFAAGVRGNSYAFASGVTKGITRLGASGDWISVGYSGSGTSRRPEIRRTTNAGSTTYTNANGGTYSVESAFFDVTYDGTNLWVTARNGNTGASAIHRIDPATGTISATLTLAGLPAYWPTINSSNPVVGIEWDATNSWLWVTTQAGYIFNVNTSGNWLGVLMRTTTNSFATLSGQFAGVAPVTRGINEVEDVNLSMVNTGIAANSQSTNPYGMAAGAGAVTNAGANPSVGAGTKLLTISSCVWFKVPNAPGTFNGGSAAGTLKAILYGFTDDPNFGSRTRLGSATTKLNTQTMRIKYTMTFT